MKKILIFRIDPVRQAITAVALSPKPDLRPQMLKAIKGKSIEHNILIQSDEEILAVAADPLAEEDIPGFRLRGQQTTTAGTGLMFGVDPKEGFKACPKDIRWLRTMVVWLSPDEMAEAEKQEQSTEVDDDSM